MKRPAPSLAAFIAAWVLFLPGCGSTPAGSGPSGSTATSSPGAAKGGASASASAEAKDEGAGVAAASTSGCSPPEGVRSDLQLQQTGLTRSSSTVAIQWTLNGPITSQARVELWAYVIRYLDATPSSHIQNYLVSITYQRGTPIEFVIRDYANEDTLAYEPARAPHAIGRTIRVEVPLADLPGIDEEFKWQSGMTVDGERVSECPNGDDMVQYP